MKIEDLVSENVLSDFKNRMNGFFRKDLYHITPLHNAIDILKQNRFILSDGEFGAKGNYMSLTWNLKSPFITNMLISGRQRYLVCFKMNDRFNKEFKATTFDYFSEYAKNHETEFFSNTLLKKINEYEMRVFTRKKLIRQFSTYVDEYQLIDIGTGVVEGKLLVDMLHTIFKYSPRIFLTYDDFVKQKNSISSGEYIERFMS